MIQIKIKGTNEYLELQSNTALQLEYASPLFTDSVGVQAYSYPIAIPATPHNRRLLGYLNRPDTITQFTSYACEVYVSGMLFLQGSIHIQRFENNAFQAYILEREFDNTQLETRLKDIDLGGVREVIGSGPGQWEAMYLHARDAAFGAMDTGWDYTFFPVYNPDFYDHVTDYDGYNAMFQYSGYVNFWNVETINFWQNPLDTQISAAIANGVVIPLDVALPENPPCVSTFVPFPYLVSVLKYVAAHLGMSLTGGFVQDAEVKKIVIYNVFALDKIEAITGTIIGFPGTYYQNTCASDIDLRNHVPDITIAEFLTAIASAFNLYVEIDSLGRKLVLNQKQDTLTAYEESEITQAIGRSIAIEPSSFAIADGFLLKLKPDKDDSLSVLNKDTIITTEKLGEDIGALPFVGTDPNGLTRFVMTEYVDATKLGASLVKRGAMLSSAPNYREGNGKEEIEIGLCSLHTVANRTVNYVNFASPSSPPVDTSWLSGVVPMAKQKGAGNYYGLSPDAPFSFRILNYIGIGAAPIVGDDYPYGSNTIYNHQGDPVTTLSLKWIGNDSSLYPKWHERWLPIRKNKTFTYIWNLSLTDLMEIDWSKKLRIQNQLYLLKTLSVAITSKGATLAKATFLKLLE
jgi:hypothetical protein